MDELRREPEEIDLAALPRDDFKTEQFCDFLAVRSDVPRAAMLEQLGKVAVEARLASAAMARWHVVRVEGDKAVVHVGTKPARLYSGQDRCRVEHVVYFKKEALDAAGRAAAQEKIMRKVHGAVTVRPASGRSAGHRADRDGPSLPKWMDNK